MASEVCATGRLAGVVDCWAAEAPDSTDLDTGGYALFLGALQLGHALGPRTTVRPLPIVLAARGTDRLLPDDVVDPARCVQRRSGPGHPAGAPRLPPHPRRRRRPSRRFRISCSPSSPRPRPNPTSRFGTANGSSAPIDRRRLPTPTTSHWLPEQPVVMVTGGLGYMGITLGESLFASADARLVLVGRSSFPDPEQWLERSEDPSFDEHEREILRRLAAMRSVRDDVLVLTADLRDEAQVRAAVDAACERFGAIDVVIHGAANVSPAAFGPVADTGRSVIANQISPKLHGLELLIEAHARARAGSLGAALVDLVGARRARSLRVHGRERGPRQHRDREAALPGSASAGTHGTTPPRPRWPGCPPRSGRRRARRRSSERSARPSDLASSSRSVTSTLVSNPGCAGPRSPSRPRADTVIPDRTSRRRSSNRHRRPRARLAEIWASQLGLDKVGVHDRFFDLGGHSLLAVQVASEIRDRFQIEMPVLQLFKAPTIRELAELIEQAELTGGVVDAADTRSGGGVTAESVAVDTGPIATGPTAGPGDLAKASYREFYDDVSRRLAATGMGEASFFLNYGYVSQGNGDEARFEVPEEVPNRNSIRLALELVGDTELEGKVALDVGCGRGGTASLLAEQFGAEAAGVDLSPEAIAFCRNAHRAPALRFEVGDAENLPFDDDSFDVVTNLESSHTYPDMRAFLGEVTRVLRPGGWFLHTDLLAGQRWMEVQAILAALGFTTVDNREITANVLASCDEVAENRTEAFGARDATIDNFLAIPGSPVYEQMASGAWEYRILRSRLRVMTAMTATRIDAWLLPVVRGAADAPEFVAVVGPDDTEKISRLGLPRDRDRAVSARVAARTEIGRRLGIPAADVPLVGDDRRWIADSDVTVSWSHSGDWIALAIAHDLPVGIDIEQVPDQPRPRRPRRDRRRVVGGVRRPRSGEQGDQLRLRPGVATPHHRPPPRRAAAIRRRGRGARRRVERRSAHAFTPRGMERLVRKPLSGQSPSVTVRVTPSPRPKAPCHVRN